MVVLYMVAHLKIVKSYWSQGIYECRKKRTLENYKGQNMYRVISVKHTFKPRRI